MTAWWPKGQFDRGGPVDNVQTSTICTVLPCHLNKIYLLTYCNSDSLTQSDCCGTVAFRLSEALRCCTPEILKERTHVRASKQWLIWRNVFWRVSQIPWQRPSVRLKQGEFWHLFIFVLSSSFYDFEQQPTSFSLNVSFLFEPPTDWGLTICSLNFLWI